MTGDADALGKAIDAEVGALFGVWEVRSTQPIDCIIDRTLGPRASRKSILAKAVACDALNVSTDRLICKQSVPTSCRCCALRIGPFASDTCCARVPVVRSSYVIRKSDQRAWP